MAHRPRRRAAPLPTKEQLIEFIRENPSAVGRRDITRAFAIAPADRRDLTAMIRELEDDGLIERRQKRRFADPGTLPEVTVLEITGPDSDGDLMARPANWPGPGTPPRIVVIPERRAGRAPGSGDRVLARLRKQGDGTWTARIMRVLDTGPRRVLGIFRAMPDGGRIEPTDRRARQEYLVAAHDTQGAKPGELVRGEALPGRRTMGMIPAKVIERLGSSEAPGAASLIALTSRGIPDTFGAAALNEAERAKPAPMGKRTDLRDLALVTLDDEDARDFDDAVWAEPDDDAENKDGWHLVVAIADVAWYVQPGSALDRTAKERGNSVYFPDRVVPMLPEALSNGLCSLKPGEDRPVMAVHIWIDKDGNKRRHYFVRGMMRSAARLTYTEAQAMRDAGEDGPAGVVPPLYGAYESLRAARRERGTLDLDMAERRIIMDDKGRIERIEPRARYDSHRLIEEFMILANVCAAETLESLRQPCMYRVHEEPSPAKVEALRTYLEGLGAGLRLARGQVLQPHHFSRVAERALETPHAHVVNEMILRSQSRAAYSPANLGHFGLALRRYSHFTSPIRRYADLLVHRALIGGLKLGDDGLDRDTAETFAEIGEHLSMTERRAAEAERDAADRLTAAFLADRVGSDFAARIHGVTRFGVFVTLDDTGADGLVPMSALGDEAFRIDEDRHVLTGTRSRRRIALGDAVTVRLEEASPVTGGLIFSIVGARPGSGAARKGTARKGPAKKGKAKAAKKPAAKRTPRKPAKGRGRKKR